jgi:F-type H+-transporting ATPase subunit delta
MSVSHSYANALYEAFLDSPESKESTGAKKIEDQLNSFLSALQVSRETRVALISPLTTLKEKEQLVQEISKKAKMSEIVTQFLRLLTKKGRLEILAEIVNSYRTIRLVREGGVPGFLTVAEPMTESDIEMISKVLGKKLGKKVTFQVSTDPSLLAGLKVTVSGVTYDGTLRSQLQNIRDHFVTGISGNLN